MNTQDLIEFLTGLGEETRAVTRRFLNENDAAARTAVARESISDTVFRIDEAVEHMLEERLEERAGDFGGIVLVAEGIGENDLTVWPRGAREEDAAVRLLVDPIDGTRCLMHNKRSAFFLAGAAPNRGPETRLRDIHAAVMVELPTTRARLADAFWAVRGAGAAGETTDLFSGERENLDPAPYPGPSIRGGFAQISRFFQNGKTLLAGLEEELVSTLFPDGRPGETLTYEDQYTSSGGQLYELLTGKDRFTADVRATLFRSRAFAGRTPGHACHPYDLAAHLIGEEAGCPVTDARGDLLDGPFTTTEPMDWIGYANPVIRSQVEPTLLALLRRHLAPA